MFFCLFVVVRGVYVCEIFVCLCVWDGVIFFLGGGGVGVTCSRSTGICLTPNCCCFLEGVGGGGAK